MKATNEQGRLQRLGFFSRGVIYRRFIKDGVFKTEHGVDQQKQRAAVAGDRFDPRVHSHQASKATDADNDQYRIGHCAAQAYPEDVVIADTLFEHKSILGTNGQDKTEAQAETGDQSI